MGQKVVYRYSEAFKLQIVSELESGKLGDMAEARFRYGIPGKSTVAAWLRKYGRNAQLGRIVRVETPNERDRLKQLRQENDRLKKALADEHLKAVLYESWFEVACEEFGVQDLDAFKKKLEGRR